jgi:hypothetical protein
MKSLSVRLGRLVSSWSGSDRGCHWSSIGGEGAFEAIA